jgi:hypothetical protein
MRVLMPSAEVLVLLTLLVFYAKLLVRVVEIGALGHLEIATPPRLAWVP